MVAEWRRGLRGTGTANVERSTDHAVACVRLTAPRRIVVLATLDTKDEEAAYLVQRHPQPRPRTVGRRHRPRAAPTRRTPTSRVTTSPAPRGRAPRRSPRCHVPRRWRSSPPEPRHSSGASSPRAPSTPRPASAAERAPGSRSEILAALPHGFPKLHPLDAQRSRRDPRHHGHAERGRHRRCQPPAGAGARECGRRDLRHGRGRRRRRSRPSARRWP